MRRDFLLSRTSCIATPSKAMRTPGTELESTGTLPPVRAEATPAPISPVSGATSMPSSKSAWASVDPVKQSCVVRNSVTFRARRVMRTSSRQPGSVW